MRTFVFVLGIFLMVSCNRGSKQQNDMNTNAEPALTEVTLNIGGMHCEMCVASIEKGIAVVEGVESVKAVLNDSTAVVKFDEDATSLAEITQAVEQRGYTVKE